MAGERQRPVPASVPGTLLQQLLTTDYTEHNGISTDQATRELNGLAREFSAASHSDESVGIRPFAV
jgi:hypothetical protein